MIYLSLARSTQHVEVTFASQHHQTALEAPEACSAGPNGRGAIKTVFALSKIRLTRFLSAAFDLMDLFCRDKRVIAVTGTHFYC